MALRELPSALRRLAIKDTRSTATFLSQNCRRYASTEAPGAQNGSQDLQDLESNTSFSALEIQDEKVATYDPVKRAQGRKRELPASR
jgi:large subunit ribosomal protein L5